MGDKDLERRYTAEAVALRAGGDGGRQLGGYALKFGKLSRNLGGFVERVAAGAVTKSVADRLDVLARWQHRDEFLLGRVAADTLRLLIDEVGLDYTVDLPETTAGRDVEALAARGDLRHSSFAFYTLDDSWEISDAGFPVRTLEQVQLVDVAPVVEPAYLDTTTGLRSLAERRGVELAEVQAMAQADRLAELVKRSTQPTVIDVGAHTTPVVDREGGSGGQVDNHPQLATRRRRLELLRLRHPAGQVDNHPAQTA